MGHAMVARLLAADQDVHLWNRTRAKAEDLTRLGATVVDTVAALADRDVVFTMVSADDDLLAVTLGPGGLLNQPTAPRYLVDSSTVSAETSERVRQAAAVRGTTLLAAPVSGNAKVVASGRLSVAVSGPRSGFDDVEPLAIDHFDSGPLMLEAAAQGLGIAFMHESHLIDAHDRRLTRLFDVEVESPYSYWFVCRPRALRTKPVKWFHDWMIGALAAD